MKMYLKIFVIAELMVMMVTGFVHLIAIIMGHGFELEAYPVLAMVTVTTLIVLFLINYVLELNENCKS